MTNNELITIVNNMVEDIYKTDADVLKVAKHNDYIRNLNELRETKDITDEQFNLVKNTLFNAVLKDS